MDFLIIIFVFLVTLLICRKINNNYDGYKSKSKKVIKSKKQENIPVNKNISINKEKKIEKQIINKELVKNDNINNTEKEIVKSLIKKKIVLPKQEKIEPIKEVVLKPIKNEILNTNDKISIDEIKIEKDKIKIEKDKVKIEKDEKKIEKDEVEIEKDEVNIEKDEVKTDKKELKPEEEKNDVTLENKVKPAIVPKIRSDNYNNLINELKGSSILDIIIRFILTLQHINNFILEDFDEEEMSCLKKIVNKVKYQEILNKLKSNQGIILNVGHSLLNINFTEILDDMINIEKCFIKITSRFEKSVFIDYMKKFKLGVYKDIIKIKEKMKDEFDNLEKMSAELESLKDKTLDDLKEKNVDNLYDDTKYENKQPENLIEGVNTQNPIYIKNIINNISAYQKYSTYDD